MPYFDYCLCDEPDGELVPCPDCRQYTDLTLCGECDRVVTECPECSVMTWGVCDDCGAAAGPDCDCPEPCDCPLAGTGEHICLVHM